MNEHPNVPPIHFALFALPVVGSITGLTAGAVVGELLTLSTLLWCAAGIGTAIGVECATVAATAAVSAKERGRQGSDWTLEAAAGTWYAALATGFVIAFTVVVVGFVNGGIGAAVLAGLAGAALGGAIAAAGVYLITQKVGIRY